MVLRNSRKLLLIAGVALLGMVFVGLASIIFLREDSTEPQSEPEEQAIHQTDTVVIDDIVVDSVESIIQEHSGDPLEVYSLLSYSGTSKVYVGKDEEAIPYFVAAYDFAQNDEQKNNTAVRIYTSAMKVGNTELINEFKQEAENSLNNPTITGSSEDVQ